jgi:hypothetical protein
MLKRWGANAFHASDFYPGGGEFKRDTERKKQWHDEDSKRIPSMIGTKLARVVAIAFLPEEFERKASQRWKDRFGTNVYSLAVQLCMISLGFWLKDTRSSEHFAYFQESGDKGQARVDEAVTMMRDDKDYGPLVRVQTFSTVEKGAERGLEASDFVAWHWNKHYMDRFKRGDDRPRKDFAAFMKLAENKVSTSFVTDDRLKEFFRVADLP